MMLSSGRDSGYCENAGPELVENNRQTFCPSRSKIVDGPADLIGNYDVANVNGVGEDVHLLLPPDCRITGSSCRALKHAVSNLTRLDDFVCLKIGDGFFSEVFKVTHRVTGRVMVLKMNLLRSNRANMLKEVQLMNRLSHPNILKFMGVCVHEGQLHALTEYINGGSLEQLIQSTQELTYSIRMKLALDIAKGMQYLHSQDVFHRDLTSKNVLIEQSEDRKKMTAVVGDFGLAAKIPSPGVRLATVGSPWWMSPECLKGQCYDERSDIFSYGIVLCEMIARVDADPDVLPRTPNFGLDYVQFAEICSQLEEPPPPNFLKLAFLCCNLEPKNRPSFADVVSRLENIKLPRSALYYMNRYALTEARSEETLLCLSPSPVMSSETKNNHRKLVHRRSLSEDIGSIVFPQTTPSDKARCHQMSPMQLNSNIFHPPLKCIGESMCREDPHYVPNDGKSNPFTSKFKGVKKVLAHTNSTDLFSSCFELPSPFYGSDERKPSFYLNATDSKATSSHELPPLKSEPSFVVNNRSTNHRSSIIVEPVVKPSDIKKSSAPSYKFKFSSMETPPPVTESPRATKTKDCETEWRMSTPISTSEVSSTSSSSSSSSTTCNTASVVLKLKDDGEPKSKRYEKCKPSSLPSSPTFSRRRISLTNRFSLVKTDEVEDVYDARDKKLCSPSFLHPLCKSRGCLADSLLSNTPPCGGVLLRSYSSSSNINNLNDCSNVTSFLPMTDVPALNLRRRGSCESGFFSNVGEDFCVPGIDVCVGHHHYNTSSVTLSSSSAASSLFLDSNSEDNSMPIFLNGRYPCTYHHHHHNTSSVYTDSSEDVSSLASSETPAWDERQKPQQISKIVEYFERKQVNGGSSTLNNKLDFLESSNRIPGLHASVRRNWMQNEGQLISRSSLDYYTRRKLFEKPFTGGGSHVLAKRSTNQRLLVCEGAVKSKLPIFDKK